MSVEEYLAYYENYKSSSVEPIFFNMDDMSLAAENKHIFVLENDQKNPVALYIIFGLIVLGGIITLFIGLIGGGETLIIAGACFSGIFLLFLIIGIFAGRKTLKELHDFLIIGPDGILLSKNSVNEFIPWVKILRIDKREMTVNGLKSTDLFLFDAEFGRVVKLPTLAHNCAEIAITARGYGKWLARQENNVSIVGLYSTQYLQE